MTSYRFGFDVGTSSLGWSVLALDDEGVPCEVVNAGSRIFSEGRNPKSKATLAATRREKRQARRRGDRFQQRQRFLLSELTKAGLFPESDQERQALKVLDPLQLRSNALTEKLPPHHIGRALFHINQRRGFKSSRKDTSKETTSGMVAESIKRILIEMKLMEKGLSKEEYKELDKEKKKAAKQDEIKNKNTAFNTLAANITMTFGHFLWQRRSEHLPTRARKNVDKKLYDFYPTRKLLEDEFNKIWNAQAAYHPELLTDRLQERLRFVIFYQRPLKPQELGFCPYLPKERRTFRAMPSFQRYRMYQEVNNLSWNAFRGTKHLVDFPEARDQIIRLLERPTTLNGIVVFSKMKTVLKKLDLVEGDFSFNLETEKRKGLEGNLTTNKLQKEECVGRQWHDWSEEKQDDFVALLLDDNKSDEEVLEALKANYEITAEAAEHCLNVVNALPQGTANISLKAARLMTDKMKTDNLKQYDAVAKLFPNHEKDINELKPKLPYYGEAFAGGSHIVPGDGNQEEYEKHGNDLKFYGGITNPTVHISLNQIRSVVNELISRYGRPASIAIELARDLPKGAKGRNEVEKEQKSNQEANKKRDDKLRKQGLTINPDNRLRLKLWEEQGHLCPFSGKRICLHDLFSSDGKIEIEHLIPFSDSLDDSYNNKVICTRKANRDKGNRTPYEAFSDHPDYNWEAIHNLATQLSHNKKFRFQENAREIWQRDHKDFLGRHLNDTRYIGRMAKDYLAHICHANKIDVLTGRLTSLLRRHWGLNSVLRKHNLPEEESGKKTTKKNREDHRHHAVDAIVIGMTTRSILQKVSTESARTGNPERLFDKSDGNKSVIDPYDGFRPQVLKIINNIVVSHHAKRKSPVHLSRREKPLRSFSTTGQLHEETAYGIASKPTEKRGQLRYPKLVVRRHVENLKTEKDLNEIRDSSLRQEFLKVYSAAEGRGQDSKEAIAELARKNGIRRLRCIKTNIIGIPIKNKQGEAYKVFAGGGNWATEIYEYPAGHKKADKWVGSVIGTHEANQTSFQPGITKRPHPCAKLVMRLHINDCLQVDGYAQPMRLQKMTQGRLFLAPVFEANVDQRNRDKENGSIFLVKSPAQLQPLNARKIHISPTGMISAEKRRRGSHRKA